MSFCVLRSSSFLRSASRPPSLCQQAARPPSSSSSTSSISCSSSTFSFLRPPSLCRHVTNRGIYLTRGAYRNKKKKDPTALDGEQQQQQQHRQQHQQQQHGQQHRQQRRQQPHHEIDVRNISANTVMRDVAGSGGGVRTRLEGADSRDGVIRMTKDDSRRKSSSPAPQNPSSSSHQHSSSTSSSLQQPSSQHSSRSPPASATIKIDSLIETIRVRREQASRTLLIVPGKVEWGREESEGEGRERDERGREGEGGRETDRQTGEGKHWLRILGSFALYTYLLWPRPLSPIVRIL